MVLGVYRSEWVREIDGWVMVVAPRSSGDLKADGTTCSSEVLYLYGAEDLSDENNLLEISPSTMLPPS